MAGKNSFQLQYIVFRTAYKTILNDPKLNHSSTPEMHTEQDLNALLGSSMLYSTCLVIISEFLVIAFQEHYVPILSFHWLPWLMVERVKRMQAVLSRRLALLGKRSASQTETLSSSLQGEERRQLIPANGRTGLWVGSQFAFVTSMPETFLDLWFSSMWRHHQISSKV